MPTFRTEYLSAKAPMVWQMIATTSRGSVLPSMNAVTIEMTSGVAMPRIDEPIQKTHAVLPLMRSCAASSAAECLLVGLDEIASDEQGVDHQQDAGPGLERADRGVVGTRIG